MSIDIELCIHNITSRATLSYGSETEKNPRTLRYKKSSFEITSRLH
jgi:hypothetical protein